MEDSIPFHSPGSVPDVHLWLAGVSHLLQVALVL